MRVLLFLFLSSFLFAQQTQDYPEDEIGWQPKFFEVGLIKAYGDGGYDFGDIFFGVAYKTPKNIIYPQLGLSGNIFFDEAKESTNGRVALNAGAGFWNLFYIGGFYDFWQAGTGWQKAKNSTTGFTINLDLTELKNLAGI